jgi:hypothetical protein
MKEVFEARYARFGWSAFAALMLVACVATIV